MRPRPRPRCRCGRVVPFTGSCEPACEIGKNLTENNLPSADQQTFADLGVHPQIVAALDEVGITHPFPIQAMSIPISLVGTDMIGQARTGTGKTLAFGITLLQRISVASDDDYAELAAPGKPQALVMTPTRELALQVAKDLATAGKIREARVLTVYGGVGYEPQLEALRAGVDVVVGTPGRLLDLANRRDLDLSHVTELVLDEADEMLDLGFLPDVERLISKTPKSRQTMLFSATMPAAVMALARMHLEQPVNIRAEAHDAQMTVPDTTQFIYQAHDLDKPEIVGRLLQADGVGKVMIFTRTKRAAQRLADELEDRGFAAASIHGDLSQVLREKALKKFREDKIQVLVATDVAARGIDVAGISHVVNYECPDDDKTYVHRIGRTGRAGRKGVAVTLVDWADITKWKVINRQLDLGFDTPVETYSSSPHLFTDLEIPEGTKGRVPGSQPKERAPRPERKREERPKRERSRRRLRNGVEITDADGAGSSEVEGDEKAGKADGHGKKHHGHGHKHGLAQHNAEAAGAGESAQAASEGGEQRRRRRRRGGRGRGGKSDPGEAGTPVELRPDLLI